MTGGGIIIIEAVTDTTSEAFRGVAIMLLIIEAIINCFQELIPTL